MAKVINRAYDSYSEAVAVIANLEAAGISHNDISIVANNVDKKNDPTHKDAGVKGAEGGAAGVGAIGAGAGLLAGLGMMAIPGVGPVVAAGWLVATLAGAAAGAGVGAAAGGIIGRLTEHDVSKDDAELYMETIRRGGALVSVRTNEEHHAAAQAIMDDGKFVNMTARSQAYRANKWTAFDEKAPPYTTEQVETERGLYR